MLFKFNTILNFFFINQYKYINNSIDLFNINSIIYNHYYLFLLSFILYFFSIISLILNLKNFLITLIYIELTYFSIICIFIFMGILNHILISFCYALLLILIAASESAIGLAILIIINNFQKKLEFNNLKELRK